MSNPFTFARINGLYVIAHPGETPTTEAWESYIAHIAKYLRERDGSLAGLRTLVITDGGGPDLHQRGRLNEVLAGRTTPIAVVSSNRAVRTFLAPMSWFNPEVKLFAPREIHKALAFLLVPPDDYSLIFDLLDDLNRKQPHPLKTMAEFPPRTVPYA